MSNYQPLWEQIKAANQPFLQLTFDRIEAIVQHPLNHSFLNAKKELLEYGYRVHKISCKKQTVWFEKLDRKDTLVLYVHGMGGTADEAEHYRSLFPTCDVLGVDYRSKTPWEAAKEFSELFDTVSDQTPSVLLIANSIGAYFSICTPPKKPFTKAFFISPIVDMEQLITDKLRKHNITEQHLFEKKNILTADGDILSWEYFHYTKTHPIKWNIPTAILYGERDPLTSKPTVTAFAERIRASLTVMPNGEHWFHTPEQMDFLDQWIIDQQ